MWCTSPRRIGLRCVGTPNRDAQRDWEHQRVFYLGVEVGCDQTLGRAGHGFHRQDDGKRVHGNSRKRPQDFHQGAWIRVHGRGKGKHHGTHGPGRGHACAGSDRQSSVCRSGRPPRRCGCVRWQCLLQPFPKKPRTMRRHRVTCARSTIRISATLQSKIPGDVVHSSF